MEKHGDQSISVGMCRESPMCDAVFLRHLLGSIRVVESPTVGALQGVGFLEESRY